MFFLKLFGKFFREREPLRAQKLIVGLGNPGDKYVDTRHNAGFMVIDALETRMLQQKRKCRFNSLCSNGLLGSNSVVLAKPMTYMNRSGTAVKELIEECDIPLCDTLIIVDDFNLPLGSMRFRKEGSHGGHNGLKSVISEVGPLFPRLRVGIGPLPVGQNVTDFVLGRFSSEETQKMLRVSREAAEAIFFMIENGIEDAMNRYNSLLIE